MQLVSNELSRRRWACLFQKHQQRGLPHEAAPTTSPPGFPRLFTTNGKQQPVLGCLSARLEREGLLGCQDLEASVHARVWTTSFPGWQRPAHDTLSTSSASSSSVLAGELHQLQQAGLYGWKCCERSSEIELFCPCTKLRLPPTGSAPSSIYKQLVPGHPASAQWGLSG